MTQSAEVPVILVDDDPDEHFLFEADLEDAGMGLQMHAFTQTEPALAHLQQHQGEPALVLTDLGLAGCDPVAFIRRASELIGVGAVGVYSGAENPEMEARCRAAGASFYIVKPVTRARLEAVVAETPGLASTTAPDGRTRLVSAS
ncbi:response regulator [Maricaulis sp. CAU 1757]